MILAIDTSTEAISVAIKRNDNIFEEYKVAPREHTTLILSMIEKVLADADVQLNEIKAVAFACGPGSFTGLRISASVAQAIAVANELNVIPVSTLRGMAQGAFLKNKVENVLVALDARMDEVYSGEYKLNPDNVMELIGEEQVSDKNKISDHPNKVGEVWGGDGINIVPRARDIAEVGFYDFEKGLAVVPEEAVPVYIRGQNHG